jgi:Class III signal peptide
MKSLRNKKGQGTLEYVIIAAAVVGLAVLLMQKIQSGSQKNISEIQTGLAAGSAGTGN